MTTWKTDEEYFAATDYVSQSTLKDFAKSRVNYHRWYVAKTHQRPGSKAAQDIGSLIHTMCLEPKTVADRFWFRTKKGQRAPAGETRIPIGLEEQEIALNAYHAFCELDVARDLSLCKVEEGISWEDASTGLACKAKPDIVTPDAIYDIKSCQDSHPDAFKRDFFKFRYHWQAAWYQWGVEQSCGERLPFIILAGSKAQPYAFVEYEVDQILIDVATREVMKQLDELARCLNSDEWSDDWARPQTIECPSWLIAQQEGMSWELE